MPVARAECKPYPSFDIYAHGAGQGKILCLYFNLHGYLRADIILNHDERISTIETKE